MAILSRSREVFAVDMPGSGFSDCSCDLDCRLEAAGKRLLGLMDVIGISQCDLIGSSYGGATAVMTAALAPERIRTLVLVSPANPWSKIGRRRLASLQNRLVAAVFPRVARHLMPLQAYFIRRMYGDPSRITPGTISGYRKPLIRRGVLEHAVRIVKTWDEDMSKLQQALAAIAHIPVLLVWGSRDRVVDPASLEFMRRKFERSETSIIEGAGHLPYEECPEEFSRVVLDYFARRDSAANLPD